MDFRAFWLQKQGDAPDECEDAYAVDSILGRFAVADGATESVFAKFWADRLTYHFARGDCDDPCDLTAWLPHAQSDWADEYEGRQLPWYAEEKMRDGAFATFLGVVVTSAKGQSYEWRAVAVGDACLFHTRAGELLQAFPIDQCEQFDNVPSLLRSKVPAGDASQERAKNAQGAGQPNDRLWLMTDALAKWFLTEHQAGNKPWEDLERFRSSDDDAEAFATWIEELRNADRLRNDDIALVVVCL